LRLDLAVSDGGGVAVFVSGMMVYVLFSDVFGCSHSNH
jgi:hypothetical protein